jgi:outer membrane receptor protein involved in Fe transport
VPRTQAAGPRRRLRAVPAAGGFALLFVAAPALAEAPGAQALPAVIAEVVVTAERRSESILNVPVAVSTVSGEDFAARHVAHLGDLSAQIPNVEINSPRGNTLTDVVIRGVGIANDFSVNQASPVGIYLDDSYMASRTFSGAQAFDLDRVEVLRGPQGTLFGRNTTGGLINFITRAPALEADNARFEAGYGNFNDVRLQAAVEHTFAPDVFGVRIAGTYQNHDGYYHNINPGLSDVDDLDTAAARIEARWRPNGRLDITAKAYGQRDDNRQWNERVKLVGATAEIPTDRFGVDLTPGAFKTTSSGAQLKLVADLGRNWTLTQLTSVDHGTLHTDAIDFDGRTTGPDVSGFTQQFQSTKFRQLNGELRVAYEGQGLRAVAGVYYGDDEVRDNERYDLFTELPISPRFRYVQHRVSKAAFAQVDYAVTTSLTLTGGLRYTHDTSVYRDGHADVAIPVVPGGIINTLPGALTPACPALDCPDAVQPTQHGASDAVTGRLAVKYTFADGPMIYASYNRGYRSGAFNGIAYLSSAQLFYVRPETVDAYEIGAKGRLLDGRAQLSVAAFYNDYRNQQVNFLRVEVTGLGPFPVNILDNVPKARTMGLELEADLALTDRFSAHGAAGLLNAEYAQGSRVSGLDLGGNRLPYAPRVSGSLGFNWALGDIAGGTFVLAPTVVYSSRYFFDPTANPNVETPGYTRVNATLSWARDGYAVRFWGNNLSNEKYNGYGIDLSGITGNFAYVGAPPRTYGLTLSRTY